MTSIKIIYEDNHLLVVEKPVNMLSQGDETGDPDLLTLLKEYIKVRYNKPGNVWLGLVHRLDRPVGGVMVFARTSKSASRLSEHIRSRTFKKTYLAVLEGVPETGNGRLVDYLIKDERTNTVCIASSSESGAKQAVLEYELIKSSNHMSLVLVHLETGRPHQIRVQFSHAGYPLAGDRKYGSGNLSAQQNIALWSYRISLEHPTTHEEKTFECFPPDNYPWNLFKDYFCKINQLKS